jgi:hypothetical protein
VFDKISNIRALAGAYYQAIEDDARDAVDEAFADLFTAFPELRTVTWRQVADGDDVEIADLAVELLDGTDWSLRTPVARAP